MSVYFPLSPPFCPTFSLKKKKKKRACMGMGYSGDVREAECGFVTVILGKPEPSS